MASKKQLNIPITSELRARIDTYLKSHPDTILSRVLRRAITEFLDREEVVQKSDLSDSQKELT
jgi:predicted transcriptional regulator